MYDKTIVGTCELCGGPVAVPTVWMATIPPTPTCQHCGAEAAPNYGPTLPMRPKRVTHTSTDSGWTSDDRD